jgi:hypothetical protein
MARTHYQHPSTADLNPQQTSEHKILPLNTIFQGSSANAGHPRTLAKTQYSTQTNFRLPPAQREPAQY